MPAHEPSGSSGFARALRAATKALADRPLTRRELVALLTRRGHLPRDAEDAADRLQGSGLLSDAAAADAAAHALAARGAARDFIASRLRDRGVSDPIARRAVDGVLGDRDEAAAALELARKRARSASARLSPEAIRRRVYAWLVRRGYDEDAAADAVERAVAEITPP